MSYSIVPIVPPYATTTPRTPRPTPLTPIITTTNIQLVPFFPADPSPQTPQQGQQTLALASPFGGDQSTNTNPTEEANSQSQSQQSHNHLLISNQNSLPIILGPGPEKLSSSSGSGTSSVDGTRKRRKLRRRRSEIVRNSIQGTLQFLPANFFPNLPRPQPGLMPTRGGGQKSVASKRLVAAENCKAKAVFFYKEGDEYFTGIRVPISKSRFRTMDALMDSLNESIPLPFGVRRLHTPNGKTAIRSLDDLQAQGSYIAASGTSLRRVRGVDLEAVERRKRLRENAQRRWQFQSQQPSAQTVVSRYSGGGGAGAVPARARSSSAKSDELARSQQQLQQQIPLGRVRSRQGQYEPAEGGGGEGAGGLAASASAIRVSPFMPVTSKQIYFVLNGNPHRLYRALLNPLRRGDLDALLEEVSEGLQVAIFRLYTFEGDRIFNMEQLLQLKDMRAIAVPRHERLLLNDSIQLDVLRPQMRQQSNSMSSSLPPIGKPISSKTSSKSSSGASQTKTNNIDRLPTYDDPLARVGLLNNNEPFNRRKRSRSPLFNSQDEHLPKAAFSAEQNGAQNGTRSRAYSSAGIVSNKMPTAPHETTANAAASTSNTTADSDSGRPRSTLELESMEKEDEAEEEAPIYEEEEGNEHEADNKPVEEDEEEDEDYPIEPPELKAMHPPKRKKTKRKKKEAEMIDEEKEEEEDRNVNLSESGKKPGELTNSDKELLRQVFQDEDEEHNVEDERVEAEEMVEPPPHAKPPKKASNESMQIEVIHSDENGEPIYGPYSEELEQILYGKAAVKIQSAWRGYAVRKELKRTRFAPHPTYINGDVSSRRGGGSKNHPANNYYKPNERHEAIVQRIKTPMPQKGPSSVLKKKSNTLDPADIENETLLDSSSDREETNVAELLQAKKSLGWEMATPEKSPSLSRRSPKTDYIYTITVITGNRWAADTEADLYMILHGAEMDSERLWLRQEFTNWLQSGAKGQRFRQNQSDAFTFHVPKRIGIIKKITVGHECRGYGAGIFIDRILVTEDEEDDEDCRQFLFLCNKWFDSGQVDGKLERVIRLSAFYEIGSIPLDNRVTRGRWEFVLHNGTDKGQGGTSSQLAITGYGTRGQATTADLYDSDMAKVPSESLLQVDFGDIGELLKVRVEIDGSGQKPDYFLNFVECKDLDTDERFVVMCGKWLKWHSVKKGDQPFRELFTFHIGVEPLPLITYEGKIRVLSPRIECLNTKEVQMELHGDLGETGLFRVELLSVPAAIEAAENEKPKEEEEDENGIGNEENAGKIDIAFKVEAVSVGRVIGARVKFQPNPIGQEIMEGLLEVQSIFQRQGIWPLAGNSEFLISRILLRESQHTPYRYMLTRSQFNEIPDQSHDAYCTKELLTTEMEGVSTRRPRRKVAPKAKPKWLLQMSLANGSTLLPEVFLCGENGNARLLPLDTSPSDGMLSYQAEDSAKDIGALRKVRVLTDGQTLLTGMDWEDHGNNGNNGNGHENAENGESVEKAEDAEPSGPFSLVGKIRVCDTANGEELRFPAADCHLQKHSVFEMSAIWPDRPPTPIVIYLIRIVAGESYSPMPALTVRLNLSGELGDVGWRMLNNEDLERPPNAIAAGESASNPQLAIFAPNTRNSFEFEAVSIGEIDWAEMEVRSEQPNFHWECRELIVTDTNTALFYTFKFDNSFSADCPVQRCQTLPFTNGL